MLKRGDVVKITYYEGEDQIVESLWAVAEYDNGLAKLQRDGKTRIVNLRCVGFLFAEIEMQHG